MAKRKSKKSKKFSANIGKAVGRDAERRRQAQGAYGYLQLPQGVQVFNPKPKTKVKMDIMPYLVTEENHPDRYDEEGIAVPDSLWYKRPFRIHRNVGIENEKVVCLRSSGSACPICEYREERMKHGASYEDVQDMKASRRNLYVIIPVGSREHEEVPHIWDMSQYLFQNLLDEELKEDEDYWTFPDLEDGKTVRVRFDEGKAFGNTFAEASRIDFYDRKRGYEESILEDIPNLDEVLNILSYKELEAKFLELDPDEVGDEYEDDEAPDVDRHRKDPESEEEIEEDYEEEDWEEEEEFEEEFEEDLEDEDWDEEWEEEEDWEEDFEEEEPEPEPEPEKPKRTKKSKKKGKKKSKRTRKK